VTGSTPKIDGALPPGPRLPSALQTLYWTSRPLAFMRSCRRRFGDVFTLRIRHTGTWVLLSDPADVKQVFTAQADTLGVGEANTLLGPVLGQSSVMLLEEPAHMAHRKRMLPPFHGRQMLDYGEVVTEVTREEIARWPVGEPFALWPRMQAITLEVIMRATFGSTDAPQIRHLRELMRELTEWMNSPRRLATLAAFGPRWLVGNSSFRAVMDPVEAAVLEEVRRRRAAGEQQGQRDIYGIIETAHAAEGQPLTEQEMQDELMTLILDGPTSSSLAWSFERLMRNPEKLERLREELATGQEAYLDAVVRETLRLRPAVPVVVRRLLTPMQLGGHTVPAGATVAPCIYLMHHREDIYPEPDSFLPERFLERPAGTYTWIPFGGGVRRCAAASFALLEMKRVIQTVLQEVDLRPVRAQPEKVVRSSIAYAPEHWATATISRRTAVPA
jgi:cytochrome P450 family 135